MADKKRAWARFFNRRGAEAADVEKKRRGGDGGPTMAGGYGNHGASRTTNTLLGWIAEGASAEEDIDLQGSVLRQRSRDLYAGGGLARAAVATLTTNVVGAGILAKPKIDAELLGLSDEARDEWERMATREFELWAGNTMCDAERRQTFYGLQQLAFRAMLMSGDVFALIGEADNPRTPYKLTVKLLEADRICTPDSSGDSVSKELGGGAKIVDGVEIDKLGAVTKYHIASRHPLGDSMDPVTWTTIDAIGRDTGLPNILHVMTFERPEQRRGVPFVSGMMEQLKQLARYMKAELDANVVSAMLTMFIESDEEDSIKTLEDAVNADNKITDDEMKIELAPGAVYQLPPGKRVTHINPVRQNTGFESFIKAEQTITGAGMEIPMEVLTKKYERNYTAMRGAYLDFWKVAMVFRRMFVASFCQPLREMFLAEAVALGRLDCPGFFDDPAIREAWCGCQWIGVSMGHVDPLKEANAAGRRIELNLTTQEQEAAEYNANNWIEIISQRRKEAAFDAELAALLAEEESNNATDNAE